MSPLAPERTISLDINAQPLEAGELRSGCGRGDFLVVLEEDDLRGDLGDLQGDVAVASFEIGRAHV